MVRKQTHDWDRVFGREVKETFAGKVARRLKKVWQWICRLFI